MKIKNHNIKKILSIILITIFIFGIPLSLTGCYDATGIEKLAYVTGIGFDIGEKNIIKLTLQFAKLTTTSESGSSQPQSSTLATVECSSFDDGIEIINSYISKKINLAHCKIIVFSEKFAINGVSNEINTLTSNLEIRPDCNVLISKCEAEDFLKESIPSLTSLTARYYEILLNSKEYTGFSDNTPLWEFYINLKNSTQESIGILCGLNASYISRLNSEKSLMERDVNYKAGETPLTSDTLSQDMGLAVFSSDKIVGELTAIESICYLILTNSLDTCTISIPNPFENNSSISVKLNLKKNTKNNVELINGSPFIETNVYLDGAITSVNQGSDYSKIEHLKTIENYVSSYMSYTINNFLYKTSKYLKSDIVGFSRNIIHNYYTISDWKKVKWESLYKDSFFKVNVNTTIKSGSLFVKK